MDGDVDDVVSNPDDALVLRDVHVVGWDNETHGRLLLAGLVDASDDPLFVKDAQLRFVVANRAAARTHHLELPSEMLGRRDSEMLAADIAAAVEANDRLVLATGQAMETYGHLDTPIGRRQFATRRTPLRSANGDVIGVLGTARDITDQRRVEEALATSEERYRAIVDSTSSMVWVTDLSARIIDKAPSWGAYTGQSFDEYRGHGWMSAIHPDDRETVRSARRTATETEGRYAITYRLWNEAHQAHRHVHAQGTLRRNDAGAGIEWLGVVLDVEEQVRRDAVLRSHRQATAGLAVLGALLARTNSFEEAAAETPAALQEMLGAANVHVEASAGSWSTTSTHDRWLRPPSSDELLVEARLRSAPTDHRGIRRWTADAPGVDSDSACSALAVPVSSGVDLAGTIGVLWTEPITVDGTIIDSVLAAAQMLGDALTRANERDEEHAFTERFQRALLRPLELPAVYEVASLYLPAAATVQIGGDWFDSVPLERGRAGVVIGDVAGHGVAAAADMAEVRSVMATLLSLDLPLSTIMQRASDLVGRTKAGRVGTALVLDFDPTERTITHLSAGHPPFLIRSVDGQVRTVESPRRPMLGVSGEIGPGVAKAPFEPGDLAIAFTDGLVERRNEPLDLVIAIVADVLGSRSGLSCQALLEQIIEAVQPTRTDDIALIAVRYRQLDTND